MDRGQLSAYCGVHEQTFLGWETNELRIPDGQAQMLASLFGVSVPHLRGEDDGNGAATDGQESAA